MRWNKYGNHFNTSLENLNNKFINYENIEEIVSSIVDKEYRYHEGDLTPNGNTLRQIVLRFVLVCDSEERLIRDVETINNRIQVLGEKGEDMCYRFEAREHFKN